MCQQTDKLHKIPKKKLQTTEKRNLCRETNETQIKQHKRNKSTVRKQKKPHYM